MNGFTKVGECPKCGAPIWAPEVWMAVVPPPVTHSCNCFPQAKRETTAGTNITIKPDGKQTLED